MENYEKQTPTPLLGFTQELFKEVDLSDAELLSCHHILEIDYRVLEALCEKGLRPDRIRVLGKPYSTSVSTAEKYKSLGAFVHPGSFVVDPKRSFGDYFNDTAGQFSADTARSADKRIVWDDGGVLLKYFSNQAGLQNVYGVEQTSSGFNRMQGKPLPFPTVNMARSSAKLVHESPSIAMKNIERFMSFLDQYPEREPHSVLIIGGGPIGQHMKKELTEMGMAVSMFDTDKSLSDHSTHDSLVDIVGNYDTLIGATGSEILGATDIDALHPDCTLFSVSSSDREFDGVGWRRAAEVTSSEVHKNIQVGNRILLNNGFPLNFDGAPESVPLKYIQLTGALTLAAIYTAILMGEDVKNDWVDIPQDIQKAIVGEFQSIIGD